MEDSYTVHRRRKAAAKRREKTPEPSSRNQQLDTSDDEEEARRARMEKMAEDAEKVEQEGRRRSINADTEVADKSIKDPSILRTDDSGKLMVPEVGSRSRKSSGEETMLAAGTGPRDLEVVSGVIVPAKKSPERVRDISPKAIVRDVSPKAMVKDISPKSRVRDISPKAEMKREDPPKEPETETVREKSKERARSQMNVSDIPVKASELKRVEKRVKKKSKERLAERHSRSTDSSEDEKSGTSPRRRKSPEGKIRVKKSSCRSRPGTGTDPDSLVEKGTKEDKSSSGQKLDDGTKSGSKEKTPRRHSNHYAGDAKEELPKAMKKSETYPRSSEESSGMRTSATDIIVKKQIIPLSNDSLIEDFARAQREYLMRERSILDPDLEFQTTQEEKVTLRKRKISVAPSESEQAEIEKSVKTEELQREDFKKGSWFSWLPFFGRKKKEKMDEPEYKDNEQEKEIPPLSKAQDQKKDAKDLKKEVLEQAPSKVTILDFFRALMDIVGEFRAFSAQNPREVKIIKNLRNRCAAELLVVMIYCGLGAFVFRFTEGAFESFYKCGVKRVKRDFLDTLWNYSHNLREDDWKSMARRKLMEFEEQLHTAHEAGMHSYSGQRTWSFLNSVVYCLTVITTIGYGHISPSTTTGRAITIIYAIFGIPMFLIILADFGKLFTRGMKFLWAFVRRVYYTGSCRKVRRTVPVQEVMKGVQLVYDLATFRRPSQMNPEVIEEMQRQAQQSQTVINLDGNVPDTPGTPAMSTFAIDDEFNLPISVAISILLGYIFVGATLYYMWEDWGFFESFYFVFISMSTIGFGDYVPKHPIYMMCSIVYLVFGLALTSMCINVVQVILSDSFKQASQKIGATIGFEIAEDDGSIKPALPPPVEVADVHMTLKDSESAEKIAPKAKQEDVDL